LIQYKYNPTIKSNNQIKITSKHVIAKRNKKRELRTSKNGRTFGHRIKQRT